MRALTIGAAVLCALAFAGCSRDRAAVRQAAPGPLPGAPATATEDRFVDLHAILLDELASWEGTGVADPRAMEARSLVEAAEDAYLGGDAPLALGLLEDGRSILAGGR